MIRQIEEKDISACLNIYNYYIENTTITFEEDLMSAEEFLSRVRFIVQKYPYLVYEENNEVLGYAYLNTFNDRSAYRYTADLSIYIDKDHKGKGIGKQLYQQLEKNGRESGITNIISLITEENTASCLFHEKMGFYKVGMLSNVGIKFNRILSVYYYQKSIK